MATTTDRLAVVVCKDRDPSPEQDRLVMDLLAALEHRPELDVTLMPHLYDLAPEGPGMAFLRSIPGPMIVLAWLYPRATFWVLDAHGVRGRLGRTGSLSHEDAEPAAPQGRRSGTADRMIWCFDLRDHSQPEPYVRQIEWIAQTVLAPAAVVPAAPNGKARVVEEATRPRWYPVVDFDCCMNCLECLNFCLFGVYSLGEANAVQVEQPDACRDGCPACARICPHGAIMFPQHKDPAIAGDLEAARQGLKVDLSGLFGGGGAAELAASERQRAVAEKHQADQPGPSPAESDQDLDRLVDKLDNMEL